MSAIHNLHRWIQRMWGVAALHVIDDTGDQQLAQVHFGAGGPDLLEEIIDKVPRCGEYGLAYCPPDGSEAVTIFLGGRRSSGVIIATGHKATRPKGLKPGEAMLYNGLAATFVKMSQDGKIRSTATDWIHTGDQHLTGTEYAAHMIPTDGASGTFTTVDGKTVTVTHGIITQIV